MSKGFEIRCYDYVNHPYEKVRDALKREALDVFQRATKTAASRAQSVAAELHSTRSRNTSGRRSPLLVRDGLILQV